MSLLLAVIRANGANEMFILYLAPTFAGWVAGCFPTSHQLGEDQAHVRPVAGA